MHDASARSHTVAMLLHWLMALVIIGMIAVGFFMEDITPIGLRVQIYQLHKSLGLTILLLALVRLAWRLSHRAPALPVQMPAWEKLAARLSHVALYAFMIVMPLTGWLYISTSSSTYPTLYFGLFEVPKLAFFSDASRKDMHNLFGGAHELLAFGAIALISVHVAAALKHHFIDRDDVLTRMLPRFKRPTA